jgi:hypothetical protein
MAVNGALLHLWVLGDGYRRPQCLEARMSWPRTGILGQDRADDRGHHDHERACREPAEQGERHSEEPVLLLVADHDGGQVEGGQAAQDGEADRGQQPAGGKQPWPDPAPEQDPARPCPQRPSSREGHQVLQEGTRRNAPHQAAEEK